MAITLCQLAMPIAGSARVGAPVVQTGFALTGRVRQFLCELQGSASYHDDILSAELISRAELEALRGLSPAAPVL